MLGQKILPAAMLAVLPAAAALTVSLAKATADECRTKPGPTASPGKHWFYRINRSDHQHCWYLRPAETVQSTHARRVSILHRPLIRQGATEQSDGDQQPTSTYLGPKEATVQESLPRMNFASRWANWTPQDLPANEVAAIGYVGASTARDADQQAQIVGPADDADSMRPQHAVGGFPYGLFLLTGALAIALPALAAALLKGARGSRASHSNGLATPNQPGHSRRLRRASPSETTGGRLLARTQTCPSAWQAGTPPDPSDDFETGLQELMGALRRARAAPYKLRSFAPATGSRRASRS